MNEFLQTRKISERPTSLLFTDRKKIPNLRQAIDNLPQNSAVIIREYDLSFSQREAFAKEIEGLIRARKIRSKIIIGKNFALARKIRADGVHFSDFDRMPANFLGKKLPKNFIFSFVCHDLASFVRLRNLKPRPEIVFVAPVFPTTSHSGTKTFPFKNLAKISSKRQSQFYCPTKLYALGGVNKKNLNKLRKLGFSGFGAIDFFTKNT
jgi:thiamine-phosphate pyrophosphorylase